MRVYHFPVYLNEYKYTQSSEHVRVKLHEDAELFGLRKMCLMVNERVFVGAFTLKCRIDRDCPWRFAYRKTKKFKECLFELWRFCTKHCHSFGNDFYKKPNNKFERHPDIVPMVGGLLDLNYCKQDIVLYVTKKAGISRAYSNYVCYSGNEAIFNTQQQSFEFWYQHFRSEFELFCYPQVKEVNKFPKMLVITHKNQMQIYKNRGHVIGIHIREHQISDVSNTFYQYNHATFYIYNSSNVYLPLCFAIYEANNNTNLMHYEPENAAIRIDDNLYKILKTFLEVMGPRVRTFVIDDQAIMIETLKFFIHSHPNHQISFIVDPNSSVKNRLPKSLQKSCLQLAKSKTPEEYQALHRLIKKSLSTEEELELFQDFHQNISSFLIFNHKEPKFIGRWFEKQNIIKIPGGRRVENFDKSFKINKHTQYSFEQIFYKSCQGLQKSANHRSLNKINCIELLTIENLLEFDFLPSLRYKVEKDGFDMIVSGLYRCIEVDIVDIQQAQNIAEGPGTEQNLETEEKQSANSLDEKHNNKQSSTSNILLYPKANPFLATYQQLYPIAPCTKVNLPKVLPQLIRVKEKNAIFQCRLLNENLNSESKDKMLYSCSCKFVAFRGLPCVHLIKICLEYDLNIQAYIDTYWKYRWSYLEEKELAYYVQGLSVPSKGRPKNTQRNRMRFR